MRDRVNLTVGFVLGLIAMGLVFGFKQFACPDSPDVVEEPDYKQMYNDVIAAMPDTLTPIIPVFYGPAPGPNKDSLDVGEETPSHYAKVIVEDFNGKIYWTGQPDEDGIVRLSLADMCPPAPARDKMPCGEQYIEYEVIENEIVFKLHSFNCLDEEWEEGKIDTVTIFCPVDTVIAVGIKL